MLEVIERLGYRPNAVARGLASKKTTTVGVIIPDISSSYFSELARGIEDIATMYNYNIILSNSDQNKDKEFDLLNNMLGKQVDGIIFMSGNITDEHIEEFNKSSVPIVLAGSVEESGKIPSVNIDYEKAAYDATTYFIEKGHKKIAYVFGPLHEPINGRIKMNGYKKALSEAGIEYNEAFVAEGDYTYESGIEVAEKLLELEDKPTAICVATDEMAVGVVHGLQDKGYSIPDDFEIITANNTRLAIMVRPQLSSIVQPLYDIGAVAMRLLTKYMNKEEVTEHVVILPHRFEFRNSTK